MNNGRRKRLKVARGHLDSARGILTDVLREEQDGYDNMPENLQGSEQYERMEEAIDLLEDAIYSIDEAGDSIDKAGE